MGPETRMLNNTNTTITTNADNQDFVDDLMETLMSSTMAPVTLSVLILVGILLLVGMWCICCRGTCTSSSKYDRSESMASSISQDTKIIIGTLQRENTNLTRLSSRNSSVRSSIRSSNSNVFDDDLVMYFGDEEEDDKDFSAEEILVSGGKRKLFTVSEEIDPTEEGLESLEWENNEKNEDIFVPLHQKSHCKNVDDIHLQND